MAAARGTVGDVGGWRKEDEGDEGGGGDDVAAQYGRWPPKAQVAELDGFNLLAR